MFFDEHPEFLETSTTAASLQRLNLRHAAIIEENRDVLRDARVLDIASHDGRWSFAALQSGARSVVGIEGRSRLVDNANQTFTDKKIETSRFRFIAADAHEALRDGVGSFDVVMCLGFIYHTLRYVELFAGIFATGARYLIIDTRLSLDEDPVIRVDRNAVEREGMAVEDRYSHEGKTLVGIPSMSALKRMLATYRYRVESQTDWSRILEEHSSPPGAAAKYLTGERVTLLAVADR